MMKLSDLQSDQDILDYIEGCLNDFEAGISTKDETHKFLSELIIYLLTIKKNRRKPGSNPTEMSKEETPQPTAQDIQFQLNQRVWMIDGIKAKEVSVQGLKILCTYSGGGGCEKWGDHDSKNNGWPFRIQYSLSANPKELDWISQELLFESKEKLLASL